MKKFIAIMFLFLASVVFADTIDEWNAPPDAEVVKNPISRDFVSQDLGRNVYLSNCVSCHGEEGHGNGPLAKDLKPQPAALCDPEIQGQTDGALFWKISTGRGPMPKFEKVLSEEDRWNVVNYIRKFK